MVIICHDKLIYRFNLIQRPTNCGFPLPIGVNGIPAKDFMSNSPSDIEAPSNDVIAANGRTVVYGNLSPMYFLKSALLIFLLRSLCTQIMSSSL